MNKKRIFAIITFIILGLFMFAFANPLNDNGEENNANQAATGNTTNNTTENEQVLPEPDNNETTQRNATRNNTRRVIARVDNTTTLDLTIDKANAIDELRKYRDEYQFTDDSTYNKVIDDYTTKINDSTTLDDINKNLDEGKNKIDELISEDLTAYKEAAKKDIKDYAESLNLVTDYTDLLNEYNNKIDEATTKKAIDKLVSDAKKALDEMKANEVAEAKEKAIKDINEYKQEDQEYIKDIETTKEEGIKEVEASNDVKEIENIVEEIKNKIDDLIKNTTFTVNFYGFNNKLLDTQTIHYTDKAKTPKIEDVSSLNGSVWNKFVGWDKKFDDVRSDLDVHANYKITSVTGKALVIKEKANNKEVLTTKDYEVLFKSIKIDTKEEVISAINSFNGKSVKVELDDATIRSIVKPSLPTLYNKYRTISYELKVTANGVFAIGRITYHEDWELADKKDAAIEEIKKYRADDEKYIEEIKEIKNGFYNNKDNIKSLKELSEAVKDTKKAIDKAVEDKRFTVTFVGKNNVTKVASVKYKETVGAPTDKDITEPTYRNVTYELTGWDKSLRDIRKDITINAKYDIKKIVATVFLLDDESKIPENKETILYGKYTKFKTVELKTTKAVKEAIKNDKDAVVLTSDKDIRSALVESNSLPDVVNKYKNYEFYVMKFCENSEAGFHIDGKLHYDKEAELADKKDEALEEIKNYKAEDEKYINEITTSKNDFYDKLDKINSLEELDKAVEDTKNAIDDAIANKEFTVTFYGIKGKVLSKQTVGYKKSADIPKMDKNITEWSGSISLEFQGWDVEEKKLESITKNYEVHTKYKVLSATTKISILKEDLGYDYSTNIDDFNHPYNKPEVKKDKYFELAITKEIVEAVNNYRNEHIIVYSDNDKKIREVLKDEPDVFNNNKYKKLQYYVLKLQGDRFHCDARVIYDRDAEELDKAKSELQKLIDKAEDLNTKDKTDASVKDLKDKISKAKENIEGNDINAINESINDLKNIDLVDIKVTALYVKVNKAKYYDYETEFDITVTYDDNNGKNGKAKDYKVTAIDKTEGKHTATVTYKGQSKTFEYTTVINKIESIKVTNNKSEYYIHEKSGIIVKATYTDGSTKNLGTNEYEFIKKFDSSTTTYYWYWYHYVTEPRTATVRANGKTDSFTYSVSRTAIEELVTIEFDYSNRKLTFNNLDSCVSVKSMKKTYLFDDDYIINLESTSNRNVFYVDEKSAGKIHRTNTVPSGQHLVVTYVIDGKEYEVRYNEIFNIVY